MEGRRDRGLDGGKGGGCAFSFPRSEARGLLARPRILGCYKGQHCVVAAHAAGVRETWRHPGSVWGEGDWEAETERRKVLGEPNRLQRCAAGRVCFLRCITLATREPRILNCPRVSMSGDQNRAGCRDLVAVDLRMWVLLCQERPCGW